MRMAWLGLLCLTVLVLGCDRLLPLGHSPDGAADQAARETNTIHDAPVPFDAVLTDGRSDGRSLPDLTQSIDVSINEDHARFPDTLPPICAQLCPGCCDSNTKLCQPGNSPGACGTNNTECKVCQDNQCCINGKCGGCP